MMKTFGLLILICSIIDIGIAKPSKHFLVDTNLDAIGADYWSDYKERKEIFDKTTWEGKGSAGKEVKNVRDDEFEELLVEKQIRKYIAFYDKDGSGSLSVKEYVGENSWNRWKKLKTEKERQSKANTRLRKYVEERTGRFKDTDKNGDGVVDYNEYRRVSLNPTEADKEKERKRMFNARDWDDNGTLSLKEVITIDLWNLWAKLPAKERNNPKERTNQSTKKIIERIIADFAKNDKNGNGVLEFKEYFDAKNQTEVEKDRDGSGTLTMKEMVPELNKWLELEENEREDPKDPDNQLLKMIIEIGIARFKKHDKNGDGSMDFYEYNEYLKD